MSDAPNSAPTPLDAPAWRKPLIVLVCLVVGAAVLGRWITYEPAQAAPVAHTLNDPGSTLGHLKPGEMRVLKAPKPAEETVARAPEPKGLAKYLPFVSEGGLALLLGVGLGLASRAFAKLLALGVLLFFVALEYFAYQGVVSVDYAALFEWLRRFVFNIGDGGDLVATIKDKLPAMGSLGVGYLVGLKK